MDERKARKRLAENLRALRLMRGWSQGDLAHAAGLHRTYVGAIERADRNVTLDNVERLACAFGLTIPEILADLDPTELGRRLLEKLRGGLREEEPCRETERKRE